MRRCVQCAVVWRCVVQLGLGISGCKIGRRVGCFVSSRLGVWRCLVRIGSFGPFRLVKIGCRVGWAVGLVRIGRLRMFCLVKIGRRLGCSDSRALPAVHAGPPWFAKNLDLGNRQHRVRGRSFADTDLLAHGVAEKFVGAAGGHRHRQPSAVEPHVGGEDLGVRTRHLLPAAVAAQPDSDVAHVLRAPEVHPGPVRRAAAGVPLLLVAGARAVQTVPIGEVGLAGRVAGVALGADRGRDAPRDVRGGAWRAERTADSGPQRAHATRRARLRGPGDPAPGAPASRRARPKAIRGERVSVLPPVDMHCTEKRAGRDCTAPPRTASNPIAAPRSAPRRARTCAAPHRPTPNSSPPLRTTAPHCTAPHEASMRPLQAHQGCGMLQSLVLDAQQQQQYRSSPSHAAPGQIAPLGQYRARRGPMGRSAHVRQARAPSGLRPLLPVVLGCSCGAGLPCCSACRVGMYRHPR